MSPFELEAYPREEDSALFRLCQVEEPSFAALDYEVPDIPSRRTAWQAFESESEDSIGGCKLHGRCQELVFDGVEAVGHECLPEEEEELVFLGPRSSTQAMYYQQQFSVT